MTAADSHPESGRGGRDWSSGFLPQATPRLFRSPGAVNTQSPAQGKLVTCGPNTTSKEVLVPCSVLCRSQLN